MPAEGSAKIEAASIIEQIDFAILDFLSGIVANDMSACGVATRRSSRLFGWRTITTRRPRQHLRWTTMTVGALFHVHRASLVPPTQHVVVLTIIDIPVDALADWGLPLRVAA